MDVPPFINIGGTCPPCPIGIDAPATHGQLESNVGAVAFVSSRPYTIVS